jgi:hypothetical protein
VIVIGPVLKMENAAYVHDHEHVNGHVYVDMLVHVEVDEAFAA